MSDSGTACPGNETMIATPDFARELYVTVTGSIHMVYVTVTVDLREMKMKRLIREMNRVLNENQSL